jgi:hypothetical protein
LNFRFAGGVKGYKVSAYFDPGRKQGDSGWEMVEVIERIVEIGFERMF